MEYRSQTWKEVSFVEMNKKKKHPYVYGKNVANLYKDVEVSIEEITPETAERMLMANTHNRDIALGRQPIRRAISDGEWKLNGASIVFSNEGVLLDGQHRLTACIETGTTITSVVVRGIDPLAQITMDTGKKRTLAEYLKLLGYPDYNNVAAIGGAICRAEEYGIAAGVNSATGYEQTLNHTLHWIVDNYDKRVNPIRFQAREVSSKFKGVSSKVPAVILDNLLQNGADVEDIDCFVDELTEKLTPRSCIFLLQKQLRANAESKKGHMPQRTVAALLVKTWNAYITGEEVKQLRFRQGGAKPESFPEIIIP